MSHFASFRQKSPFPEACSGALDLALSLTAWKTENNEDQTAAPLTLMGSPNLVLLFVKFVFSHLGLDYPLSIPSLSQLSS